MFIFGKVSKHLRRTWLVDHNMDSLCLWNNTHAVIISICQQRNKVVYKAMEAGLYGITILPYPGSSVLLFISDGVILTLCLNYVRYHLRLHEFSNYSVVLIVPILY